MVYGANVRAKARTSLSRPILGIQLRHLPGSTEPSGLSMHRRCAQRKFLRFWLPMLTKFFFFFIYFAPPQPIQAGASLCYRRGVLSLFGAPVVCVLALFFGWRALSSRGFGR